jgi:hypothetical protein
MSKSKIDATMTLSKDTSMGDFPIFQHSELAYEPGGCVSGGWGAASLSPNALLRSAYCASAMTITR